MPPLRVTVIGGELADRALFSNIASVTSIAAETAPLAGAEETALATANAILASVDQAAVLKDFFAHRPAAKGSILMLALRTPLHSVDAAALTTIGDLGNALDMEIVSVQSAPVDFRRDAELLFVLARRQQALEGDMIALLKSAILLEAFALCAAAIDRVRAYNSLAPDDDAIDVDKIDREYEVVPFPRAEFTSLARPGGVAVAEVAREAKMPTETYLSIHFDLFHRPDGQQRLIELIKNLARPEQTEVLVRVSSSGPPPDLYHYMRGQARRGPAIKFIVDPLPVPGPNPSSRVFLAETANTARLVAYFGAEAVPVEAGWDNDLRCMAEKAEGRVFSFKHSGHKTRYLLSPQDALDAAENFPVVSRAWFEVCEVWSPANVPPAQFQTLVAFYFDHIDWMNKHRFMQLIPVMTVQTQPIDGTQSARKRYVPSRADHEQALQLAMRLFAREASHRAGVDEFQCTYDYRRGLLTMQLNEPVPSARTFKLRPPKSHHPF